MLILKCAWFFCSIWRGNNLNFLGTGSIGGQSVSQLTTNLEFYMYQIPGLTKYLLLISGQGMFS